MSKVDLKNATVKLIDGSVEPKTITLNVGTGTLTITQTRNLNYELNGGSLDTVREGDEAPLEVALDISWENLKATTDVTPYEFITGSGAGLLSSDTDSCAPYACTLIVELDPTIRTPSCSADDDRNKIEIADFRFETVNMSLADGQLSIAGKANVTAPTVTMITT